jgi:flotillin
MLIIAQQLPEIARIQVDAIKNLAIDKVVVWDNMSNGQGVPTTANFLSGMLNSLPQYHDLFKMVGLNLPEVLGKPIVSENETPAAVTK